jgi:hypothetical protein
MKKESLLVIFMKKIKKILLILAALFIVSAVFSVTALADPDVAAAIESTWNATKTQIKTVVNNVVFPALDVILAIAFFVKLAGSYFDYRKHGQFEWTAPVVLFACLLFSLTAPTYLWGIVGM